MCHLNKHLKVEMNICLSDGVHMLPPLPETRVKNNRDHDFTLRDKELREMEVQAIESHLYYSNEDYSMLYILKCVYYVYISYTCTCKYLLLHVYTLGFI